ncbi:MAG: hypothetical protein ACRD96_21880 [Bryobacteraceae bacterium]
MAKPDLLAQGKIFLQHVVPGIMRPIRALWHEVIGFVFLALAAWAVPSAWRLSREFSGDAESFFKLVLIGVFVLIMAGFGVSSFLRARKISRS